MNLEKEIRKVLVDEEMTPSDLSKIYNCTPQNMIAKIKNPNMKFSELQKLMDCIGYEVKIVFIKKEGNKE